MPRARAGRGSGQLLRGVLASCPTRLLSSWENPHLDVPRVCLSWQEETLGDAGAPAWQKILWWLQIYCQKKQNEILFSS